MERKPISGMFTTLLYDLLPISLLLQKPTQNESPINFPNKFLLNWVCNWGSRGHIIRVPQLFCKLLISGSSNLITKQEHFWSQKSSWFWRVLVFLPLVKKSNSGFRKHLAGIVFQKLFDFVSNGMFIFFYPTLRKD